LVTRRGKLRRKKKYDIYPKPGKRKIWGRAKEGKNILLEKKGELPCGSVESAKMKKKKSKGGGVGDEERGGPQKRKKAITLLGRVYGENGLLRNSHAEVKEE